MLIIPEFLEAERLILRRPVESDRAAYVAFYGSPRSRMALGPMDAEAASAFFDQETALWETKGFGMYTLTIKGSDAPMGLVGMWYPDTWAEPELGWLLWDEAEGHGYATEAARACLRMWRGLGHPEPVSYIMRENASSAKVARRLGAFVEGIHSKDDGCEVWRHSHTPILQTERLILRRPHGDDWPMAREFFMSERAQGIGGPYDEGEAWRKLAMEIGHWDVYGFGMWVVTRAGEDRALGMIGPWCPPDWPETEIGWMIWDQACEGTGIATEAARAVIAHCFDVLKWETAVHYISHDNARSIALAEKLGAVRDDCAPQIPGKDPHLVYRSPKPEVSQ